MIGEPLYRCPECLDTGMVEVTTDGHGTVRPCSRCRAETYQRWAEGHYQPGHSCSACVDLARRKGNGW